MNKNFSAYKLGKTIRITICHDKTHGPSLIGYAVEGKRGKNTCHRLVQTPELFHFYHFIGNLGQSNNVFFVTFVWNYFLIPLLNDFNEIQIFSDGASKHFKQSGFMAYFSDLQIKLNKKIVYKFLRELSLS